MKNLFGYFLKLGSTGFGGPIALIGMMERHFVQESKQLTAKEFQQFVAAAKLFPGPTATLIAIRIGNRLQGIRGALTSGFALIFPAFFMILGLAALAQDHIENETPWIRTLFEGLNLGGLALSVIAAVNFAKPLIRQESLFYLLISGILTFFHPTHEIYFLFSCGILSLVHQRMKGRILDAASPILFTLFFESLKASLLTFGSGIAIVPVLKALYIDQYHWLDSKTFLTALSFGQMTPGPLVIMNTYLGHQAAGLEGSVLATAGTFLPTFLFGIFFMPALERKILSAPSLNAFFAGMIPAVGGAILGSVARLCLMTFENDTSGFTLSIFCGLAVLAIWFNRIHPIFILLLGALLTGAGFLFETAR